MGEYLGRTTGAGARVLAAPVLVVLVAVAVLQATVPAGAAVTDAPAAPRSPLGSIWDPAATPSWIVTVAGLSSQDDVATDVKLAEDGAVYVAGAADLHGPVWRAMTLTKIVAGSLRWTKRYVGPDGDQHLGYATSALALGPGGVVYTAGKERFIDLGELDGDERMLVVKWAPGGSVVWVRGSWATNGATAVGVDDCGNVTAAGGGVQWAVVNWSPGGTKRWTWRHAAAPSIGDTPAGVTDLRVAADGSVYVTGQTRLSSGALAAMTVKLSRNGVRQWSRTYVGAAGLGATASALAARPGGGVYVCGAVQTTGGGSDGFVVGYPASGGPRKLFTLDDGTVGDGAHVATGDETFLDVAVTTTRRVVAVGASSTGGDMDPRATIYDVTGAIVAAETRAGPWNDSYVGVARDGLGGFCVTGTEHVAAGEARILTWRRSTLSGGGGWLSVVPAPGPSTATGPRAIAARGPYVWVAGTWSAVGAGGMEQVALGYVY